MRDADACEEETQFCCIALQCRPSGPSCPCSVIQAIQAVQAVRELAATAQRAAIICSKMKRLHTLEQTLVSYEKQYEDLAVKLDRSYKHTNQQVALVKKGERAQHVHLLQTLTNLNEFMEASEGSGSL